MSRDKHRKREMHLNGILLIFLVLLIAIFMIILYPALERIFSD